VFDDLAAGQRPQTEFHINGTKYSMGYYLADGIYPDWATLVKTYSEPVSEKEKKICSDTGVSKEGCGTSFWGASVQIQDNL